MLYLLLDQLLATHIKTEQDNMWGNVTPHLGSLQEGPSLGSLSVCALPCMCVSYSLVFHLEQSHCNKKGNDWLSDDNWIIPGWMTQLLTQNCKGKWTLIWGKPSATTFPSVTWASLLCFSKPQFPYLQKELVLRLKYSKVRKFLSPCLAHKYSVNGSSYHYR